MSYDYLMSNRRFGPVSELVERMARIGNIAVHAVQEENRRKGIPNVYVRNGKIVWQLPNGSITTAHPADRSVWRDGDWSGLSSDML